ncbi:hypothetical protein V7S43_012542 [Phytophthora oleae]|uniref:Uncharacterized protein n=1 Tax=Phytophthora oleae TaxID=2107226 RepID=A0ABD3F6V0_9STRA
MIPVATKSSSSRPHTFGRSSNVWQYLDLVHDRSTPLSGERALSALSESTDNESEEEEEVQTHSRRLNEPRHVSLDSRSSSKGPIEGSKRPSRSHKGSLSGVSSLSDLYNPARLREQQGSRKTLLVNAGLRVTGASTVNSTEIMRKLNALGTSSSAPVLPVSPTTHGIENPANPALLSTQTASPMAPVAVVPVSDSEKLRNAFNSQATRLSYGCSVALELFNGHLMMVSSPDGQARVQSLEKLQSQVKGYKDRAIFTLLDLADVRSAGSIRYGDSVWLQLSVGPGDVSWEQGGVLGAKVREAPQLKALGLLDDDAIRNDVQAPAIVGYPVPVTAYLPKSRDDGDMQVDEIQSRLRNKSAKMLGKWIIRSAVCQRQLCVQQR